METHRANQYEDDIWDPDARAVKCLAGCHPQPKEVGWGHFASSFSTASP